MNKTYLICTAILDLSKTEMNEDISRRFTDWRKRKFNAHISLSNDT